MSAQATVWVCMALGVLVVLLDVASVRRLKKAAREKCRRMMDASGSTDHAAPLIVKKSC